MGDLWVARSLQLMSFMNLKTSNAPAAGARLLADVGGTNARFAWQANAGAPIERVQVLPCAGHASLQAAVWAYLRHQNLPAPGAAAVAIATPVSGDWVSMTNHHWSFSQAQVREEFGWSVFRVLNDFTALAMALPHLQGADLRQVGGTVAQPRGPRALIGAGTGLGVSGLLPDAADGWVAVQGEGGHVTLPATGARERQVVDGLAARHGHVSAERVLSGQGLVDVHAALCVADGHPLPTGLTPADVTARALQPDHADHARARETIDLFSGWLGVVAGNLALTLGATGGVYIGGGVVPRLGEAFDASPFRRRFEDKGRFSGYLAAIPAWVITATPSPALLGAAHALDR